MGYEIAGGLGVRMAQPDRDVYVMVGDGSYLMMAQEIVTAVQEGIKLTVVLLDNHGFASIGGLSASVGWPTASAREYRLRPGNPASSTARRCRSTSSPTPRSMGARAVKACTRAEIEARSRRRGATTPSASSSFRSIASVRVSLGSESWWDVPVAETSPLDDVRRARSDPGDASRQHVHEYRSDQHALTGPLHDAPRQLLNYVSGRWEPLAAPATRSPSSNPATGEALASVPLSRSADVDAAVQAAVKAFPPGGARRPANASSSCSSSRTCSSATCTTWRARSRRNAARRCAEIEGELRRAIENVEVACGIPSLMMGANVEDIASGIDELMIRQPVGVVAVITPFNFPGMIPLWFMPYAARLRQLRHRQAVGEDAGDHAARCSRWSSSSACHRA